MILFGTKYGEGIGATRHRWFALPNPSDRVYVTTTTTTGDTLFVSGGLV